MAPILFVEGLKIRYRSAKERLPRLSSSSQPSSQVVFQYSLIQVEKGECLGIVGQTGCGKTTLLNALFQPRFPGEVSYRRAEILGRDRNSIPAHELYSRISYLVCPECLQSLPYRGESFPSCSKKPANRGGKYLACLDGGAQTLSASSGVFSLPAQWRDETAFGPAAGFFKKAGLVYSG